MLSSSSFLIIKLIIVTLISKSLTFNPFNNRRILINSNYKINYGSLSIRKPSISTCKYFKVSESEQDEVEDDEEVVFEEVKSSSVLKKLSNGIVPLAASIGFAVTPSSGIAVRIAGAAAGGVAGLITKITVLDKLVRNQEENSLNDNDDDDNGGEGGSFVSMEVATLLERLTGGPPLITYNTKKLESVAKKVQLPENLLGELFIHVFAEVVYAAIRSPSSDVTELGDVIDFAENLALTRAEIGDGLAIVACRMGKTLKRDNRGFYTSNFPKDFLLHTAKLFFLSNKMVGENSGTGSLQGYYGQRIKVAMSYFPEEDYEEVITDACTKLFLRCIDSVLKSPEDFTVEEINQFRDFLTVSSTVSGLRPSNMQAMIMEALQQALDATIGEDPLKESMRVQLSNYQSLQKAREVFNWNPIEFDATIETKTMPIFEVAAKEIVEEVVLNHEKASELSDTLMERVSSLKIDIRKARVFLTNVISDKNMDYMKMIDRVYNVSDNSIEPAFKIMASYSTTHKALQLLTEKVMDGIDIPLPGLPFAEMVRVSMFEMQLTKNDPRVGENMFSLNDEQKKIVKKNLALPKIASWIKQCIKEDNLNPDAKAAYEKLLAEKEISQKDWQATAIDFYYQEVSTIANSRAIPTSLDMSRLEKLKAFLGCDNSELVAKTNLELFGEKYSKAIVESMTPTGVISEEYLEGLERLRDRLGISKSDAEKLLSFTSRRRLGDVVKNLVEQWKADTGAITRKDEQQLKDKSRDPISSTDNILGYMETGANVMETGGPNVFMREALNLVDFFVENYMAKDIDLTKLEALPVNAVGYAPEADLVAIYKHYVVTRLTEKSPELKLRYERDEKMFAMILGIMPESQMKVKESLLYSTYKKMLKNVLIYKDTVEATDLQQFVFLKDNLSIEKEVADRILYESSKGAVLEHASKYFRPQEGLITASMANRMRTQIASLGLNLQKDAGFNPKMISYLYTLEVQASIEEGLETDLQEIQEAYEIPQDRAEAIVEATCKRYISQLLNLALASAKKYKEDDSNKYTLQIAKYMFFFDGSVDADGNLFSEDDKDRLITFFRDREGSTLSNDDKKEISSRLKSLINLTEDFVAPVEGLAGLLGAKKTDRKDSGMMM